MEKPEGDDGKRDGNNDDDDAVQERRNDIVEEGTGAKKAAFLSMQSERIKQEEIDFRQRLQSTGTCGLIKSFFVNWYSAMLVFIFYLISLESLFSIALSVSMTIMTYYSTDDKDSFNGGIMNWILLSFSVITPMSSSISMAFGRREKALADVAALTSTLRNLYMAHACWDWSKASKSEPTGRKTCDMDWLQHSDDILHSINGLCEALTRSLTLPSTSRARHRVTSKGKAEAEAGQKLAFHLHRSKLKHLTYITQLCEELKRQGLPPNEATRIRQWERMVNERLESLRFIKEYRTPQALRSFARLFSVFLPPFYAPYYAELAQQLDSLGIGITFSVLTSIALTSLFESLTQMEDPFVGLIALDGIHVQDELVRKFRIELLDVRDDLYPDALPFVAEGDSVLVDSMSSPSFPEYRLFAED
eukprot:CAMPEP_0119570542 /NCGR_PEP_ID=MMETSP1352-20130426/43666_1 /TAXON_ID=265584 /ORGANISM="Stauroneis constricta, Strain CCMP1120" /LENGTH=417 /DNA_ID=CAMNT_0007620211 /DNA_START=30 /DNA_END=1283 /DNA_ORIENTATION=-